MSECRCTMYGDGDPTNAPFVTGFADPMVVTPGARLNFMVSASEKKARAAIVRLSHGSRLVGGPGLIEEEIAAGQIGEIACADQRSHIGSYARAPNHPAFRADTWTIRLFVRPTLLDRTQAVLEKGDVALALDDSGVTVTVAGKVVLAGPPLRLREWTALSLSYDLSAQKLTLRQRVLNPIPADRERTTEAKKLRLDLREGDFYLARSAAENATGRFNGKIDRPLVLASAFSDGRELDPHWRPEPDDIIAAWNLGREAAGVRMVDEGSHRIHGVLCQQPARAVTGCTWSAEEVDWRARPDEYSAAHFHEDDLEDIGWSVSAAWDVPADLPSGIYALRVSTGGAEDHIPFFVRAAPGHASAPVAFLVPTYSYLAYANERLSHELDFNQAGMTDREIAYDPRDNFLKARPDFGLSMYDHHRDGSGVMYASSRRPLLNLRPDYTWWLSGGPQYLAIDLCIVHWLETLGQPFDIITDHDLDDEGRALLDRYRVVVTSSHPEYHSKAMLDALSGYTQGGGRLLYLGGNGFYWVTTRMPDRPWLIEVRRGFSGNRAWESEPGEEHHAATGERGGLWRRRGLSPNALVGVGFASQGWDTQGRGYALSDETKDARAAWIFEGVNQRHIGDYGLVMGGAAGDELDRADTALGTPPHALVLGASGGHSRYYLVCQEDALFSHNMMGGDVNPNVRSDLCFFETAGGGAVFSVGSKAWAGALSHNNYDNDIARITSNVLRGFLERRFAEGSPS